jgi:hypothetical protein
MLYRATYHSGRDPYGQTTFETRILPTLRAVELWAETKLKGARVETTNDCYHRDVGRAPSITYESVKKRKTFIPPRVRRLFMTGHTRGEIFPPITIVRSVGELGYSP